MKDLHSLLLLCGLSGSLRVVGVLNKLGEFVSHELSAFVGTSSLTCEADGFLLLDGVTSLEHLHHLSLEGGESGDLLHDVADGLDAGMDSSLSVRLGHLEGVGMLLRLGHDVSLVQTDKNSCFLHHLISFKIIRIRTSHQTF